MKKRKPTVKKIEIERGLQERIEPEIGAFPLQFLRQEFSPHTYQVIDWHWHAGPQFCSVIRGNFHFRVLNRTLYLQEGDGIFINAQQVHTARPEKDSGQYLCLNLPLHLLGPEGSELFECCTAPVLYRSAAPALVFRPSDPSSAEILHRLKLCCRQADEAEDALSLPLLANLILLWDELRKTLSKSDRRDEEGLMAEISKNNARMQKILLYLKENYTRKLTLKEIADHIHLSRSECSRFFHSMTGQTLFHYLNELRINRSAELLIHTEKSAAEIAYESGFCSQSYFNQRFRAAKHMTPEQFRKEKKQ